MLQKFQANFDAYWEEGEFEPYAATPDDQARLDHQVALARGDDGVSATLPLAWFHLRPYAYQQEMLDQLEAERSLHQRFRNLVVAATGTGKTVLAAFDVARLHRDFPEQFPFPEPPRLLFIAHRKEILQQALLTFRQVLRDGSFGELQVDGERPSEGRHVFASVQSLAQQDPATIQPTAYDVVIVDEFHHAAAASYRRWLHHLRPKLLLGLTATPERTDGLDILQWFDGRIAAELRLWTALDQGLLSPFHYFGIGDNTNLAALAWRQGGYVPAELSKLYTGDHHRVDLILRQLHDKLTDPQRMRALGFCVSVEHARFMASRFTAAGLAAEGLSADSPREQRQKALRRLAIGELRILFAVDLFNEGLDIPSIDTVLLLRPTESATLRSLVFLQQLGRGLRLSPETGKSCLTVLDFIGQQHRRFRFDQRFRALLGTSRSQLESQLKDGFPFLPPGCRLVLDRVSQQAVLASLRASLPTRRPALLSELRALASGGLIGPGSGLADWLEALAMEPADFYGVRGAGFTSLRRELGWLPGEPHPQEESLTRAIGAGLLHLDDPDRLRATAAALAAPSPPDPERLGERERRQWRMLTAQLCGTGKRWRPLPDALALLWQAAAWRDELRQLLDLLAERPAAGPAGRACRPPPAPAALGPAGASARSRPHQPRRDRSRVRDPARRRPLDPPRRRPLARTQPDKPAVRNPQQERSPLLPLHPLPRPGPHGRWRFAGGWSGRYRRGGCRGWGWRFEGGGRVRRERLVTSMLLPLCVAPKLIGMSNWGGFDEGGTDCRDRASSRGWLLGDLPGDSRRERPGRNHGGSKNGSAGRHRASPRGS
jgi:superfamily II DNA or RNA helicase